MLPTPLIDGKPVKLTKMQQSFVTAFVSNSDNPEQAAIEAGYSEATARVQAYELLRKPHVMQAVLTEAGMKLHQQVPSAVQTLTNLMNTARSERIRMEASQDVLDRTGFKAAERVDHRHSGGVSVEIDLG